MFHSRCALQFRLTHPRRFRNRKRCRCGGGCGESTVRCPPRYALPVVTGPAQTLPSENENLGSRGKLEKTIPLLGRSSCRHTVPGESMLAIRKPFCSSITAFNVVAVRVPTNTRNALLRFSLEAVPDVGPAHTGHSNPQFVRQLAFSRAVNNKAANFTALGGRWPRSRGPTLNNSCFTVYDWARSGPDEH